MGGGATHDVRGCSYARGGGTSGAASREWGRASGATTRSLARRPSVASSGPTASDTAAAEHAIIAAQSAGIPESGQCDGSVSSGPVGDEARAFPASSKAHRSRGPSCAVASCAVASWAVATPPADRTVERPASWCEVACPVTHATPRSCQLAWNRRRATNRPVRRRRIITGEEELAQARMRPESAIVLSKAATALAVQPLEAG